MVSIQNSNDTMQQLTSALTMPKRIATFDVFDTVLTRAIGSPESNFLLLGNQFKALGLIECSAETFARVRANAESRAFDNAGGLDSSVGLYTIYTEVQVALRLSSAQIQNLIQREIEHEFEVIRPVPQAKQLVQAARDRQEQIVYLSDMYLSAEIIQQLLEQYGLFQPGDQCLVSNEHAQSKASTKLFQYLLDQEGVTPEQVTHCGNNDWADVRQAQKVGLSVRPFFQGNLNRYEEILESYTWSTGGLTSAMAGASRLARLTIPATSEHEVALRDVAASVCAPTLTGLVLWILRRAQQLGLQRLYFVSRDGQVLVEIAKRLIKKLDFSCDLRYLYGSRQAWLLPSVTEMDEEHLSAIFTGKLKIDVDLVTVKVALARLALQPEEIRSSLEKIRLTEATWSRQLTGDEREALNQLVLDDPEIHRIVLQKAAQARQLMLTYLEQERMLEPIRFGLVDLGTGATLHYGLSAVLATAGQHPPISFYLGLRGELIENRFGRPEAYFFDRKLNLGFFDTPGVNQMVEASCSADHGTVLGYRQQGERVEPILKHHDNQPIVNWGFSLVRDTILCFADCLFLDQDQVDAWADVRQVSAAVIAKFWQRPSRSEAAAWGAFPMEDGWGKESIIHCFAVPYRWKDLLTPLWYGNNTGRRHWWHEGALAISPPKLQRLYVLFLKMGRRQRRIRQKLELGQRLKALLRR
jgi:FMN phosphatase YigB (HAD superfamily)